MGIKIFHRWLLFYLLSSTSPLWANPDTLEYCRVVFSELRVRLPIRALHYVRSVLEPKVQALETLVGAVPPRDMAGRDLATLVEKYRELLREAEKHRFNQEYKDDPELGELSRQEIAEIEIRLEKLVHPFRDKMIRYLNPLHSQTKFILEVDAAGAGPDTQVLVPQLVALYEKLGNAHGWKLEILQVESGEKGPRRVILAVEGKDAYNVLKHEVGKHRVERYSSTTTSQKNKSKVFTNEMVVTLTPQIPESELKIPDSDIQISTTTSQGPGGQHVNKSQTAVRVEHLPTGITVLIQDQRSQRQNREKALVLLRQKLKTLKDKEEAEKNLSARRAQVGIGRLGEVPRIRTYDMTKGVVTDHRTKESERKKITSLDEVDLETFQEGLQDRYLEEELMPAHAP